MNDSPGAFSLSLSCVLEESVESVAGETGGCFFENDSSAAHRGNACCISQGDFRIAICASMRLAQYRNANSVESIFARGVYTFRASKSAHCLCRRFFPRQKSSGHSLRDGGEKANRSQQPGDFFLQNLLAIENFSFF